MLAVLRHVITVRPQIARGLRDDGLLLVVQGVLEGRLDTVKEGLRLV